MKFIKRDDKTILSLKMPKWGEIADSFVKKENWGEVEGSEDKGAGERMFRMVTAMGLVVAIFLYIFWGLIKLQIVEGGKLSERAENNYILTHTIPPNRGVVFDVNGNKLVENVLGYRLYMRTYGLSSDDELKLQEEIRYLSDFVSLNYDEVWAKYESAKTDDTVGEIMVGDEIDRDSVLELKAEKANLTFFTIEEVPIRQYLMGEEFSHVLGYTGQVRLEDMDDFADVEYGDIVGMDGLEYTYDDLLRGTKGKVVVEVDAANNKVAEFHDRQVDAIDGADLYLSIDSVLQEKVYTVISQRVVQYGASGGSAIIMDVNTGKIAAMVSYPSYDNQIMVGGISEDEYDAYNQIVNNPQNPFINRAISSAQAPGSAFKIIVGSALLDSGAITKDTIIESTGIIYIGADNLPIQEFGQHVYGKLNVTKGICKSSNIFFCRGLMDYSDIETFDVYADRFGIGKLTGIDLPGENPGILPSPENKAKMAEYSPWLDEYWYPEGDTCITGFGQGITLVTPIQLTVVSGAVANGGTFWEPTVVDKIAYTDGSVVENTSVVRDKDVVAPWVWEPIRAGMKCSTTYEGVISMLADTKVKVAAKTGTAEFGAQNAQGRYEHTHAWITGYFPAENPQYSFTVLLEDGGESGRAALTIEEVINFMADRGYVEE